LNGGVDPELNLSPSTIFQQSHRTKKVSPDGPQASASLDKDQVGDTAAPG
jgi:hypothetical protein